MTDDADSGADFDRACEELTDFLTAWLEDGEDAAPMLAAMTAFIQDVAEEAAPQMQ
jgi:hypothetical protein